MSNPDAAPLPQPPETVKPEASRRDILYIGTGIVGAVGAAAALWPFVAQLAPDADTVAAGVPVEIDLAPIVLGQVVTIVWRGRPIFIRHRTEAEIAAAVNTPLSELIDPQTDAERTKPGHAQWLIVYGSCTHLGCIPLAHQGPYGGWYCPCHGSVYDTSARVRRGPAGLNLPVPAYTFLTDKQVKIGTA